MKGRMRIGFGAALIFLPARSVFAAGGENLVLLLWIRRFKRQNRFSKPEFSWITPCNYIPGIGI